MRDGSIGMTMIKITQTATHAQGRCQMASTYGENTKIFYCCCSDGFASNAIYLPTSSPFVLLQHGLQCQYVHGMNVRYEFFKWDLADRNTRYRSSGSIPRVKITDPPMFYKGKDLKLYYCYYYKE